ncbi:tRNA-specific 2-thiouridylase mnmA [Candidatus Blochmanniella vafra str. BVAF]|uniref:tRNA-specific 2-thiouridylase MnmA n=1 Tax=Blochmanniella vafra (strain BVAF) TaxID=859654 RepID=E8Q694_BLOVB|nr:tRNA 2-thiouridine(34) synthase MnmA [Candidatus Blochmannia vafer]ADV33788.1 tRNA-specific 2-thiouridylase mnmA [Candidatus Blochmannia vafer str. BVAF]
MKKVIVGISGGVDSSVSAWLLKKRGYKVEGLFMKNWENDDTQEFCASKSDLIDACSVCNTLKIPLHTVNFSREYWNNVFKVFLKLYNIGLTPNPDILCNKEIKFKYFLEFAIEDLGADFIATGHYVRRINFNNKISLIRGIDLNKDQSYFLYTLNQQQLKHCLFPIGNFTKLKVRSIAKKLNLITANKKDSMGICFIGKRNFKKFLSNYIPIQPGPIVNVHGYKIGTHQGVPFYTIGQRKGLNIGGIKNSNGKPWYVVDKKIENNSLIVAQGINHPCLMSNQFVVQQIFWIEECILTSPLQCSVKTRYRQPDSKCYIFPISKNNLRIILKYPITAITPGQSAVFYLNERCLGGGIITKHFPLMSTQ